jgi:hypothetical protein
VLGEESPWGIDAKPSTNISIYTGRRWGMNCENRDYVENVTMPAEDFIILCRVLAHLTESSELTPSSCFVEFMRNWRHTVA